MFIKENKTAFRYIDTDSDTIIKSLDNRLYEIRVEETFFGKNYYFDINTAYDKGKVAKAGVFKEIHDYIGDYFSEEGKSVREAMSLPNRLGMLFVGEPGTGKTFLAGQIAKELCEKENAIGITTTRPSSLDLGKTIDMARKNDPNRLVVMIWDEFEKDYERSGKNGLNKLLAFLDGVDSRDNVIVIATCNDLSIFPSTLLDRPGRFEKVSEFKITDEVVLDTLLEAMIPEKYKDKDYKKIIFNYLKDIKGLSVDKIKSVVRDSLVQKLKGKKGKDVLPIDDNRAALPQKDKIDKKATNLLKKRLIVDNIRDAIYDLDWDEDIGVEELVRKVSKN